MTGARVLDGVPQDDGRAALEWTTKGAENGSPVSYEGVSILENGDGKVKRFMAYCDPARLNRQIAD